MGCSIPISPCIRRDFNFSSKFQIYPIQSLSNRKTFLDDDNVLYKQVLGMTGDIEKTISSIQSIVSGLNSEMPKIAAVLNETRTAILQAQDVLEGVKNNPLIRGGIPERVKLESLFRSMREGSFE